MNKFKNQKGFSLIELMVVVAIIGILATIAVPKVSKFMAKARQTEVKSNLAAIYTAEKAFFVEYNGYVSQFNVIGYSPEGELHYNVGFGADTAAAPSGYNGVFDGPSAACQSGGDAYCDDVKCKCLTEAGVDLDAGFTAGGGTFLAAGAGNLISGSGAVDEWTMDQNRKMSNTKNGIDEDAGDAGDGGDGAGDGG